MGNCFDKYSEQCCECKYAHACGSKDYCCNKGITDPQGPVETQDSQGVTGEQGVTGSTGAVGGSGLGVFAYTHVIENINVQIGYNEGAGNNQALGGLEFVAGEDIVVNYIACYVLQTGAGTGNFQMAVLRPTSNTQAKVVAITDMVNTITPGLFELPLTAAVTLGQKGIYYFAVYNQVNGSLIGGSKAGIETTVEAPLINLRERNVTQVCTGDILSTGDVSLGRPYGS